jgi:hypothetical protein
MRSLTRVILALAFTLLTSTLTQAQTPTGTIVGQITDEQGAAVPGASIEATNAAIGLVRADVSDRAGTYRLAALPVGTYRIRIQLTGFSPYEREAMVVNVGRTATVDATLRVGGITDTVTVRPATPSIDRQSSHVGEVIDLARIQSLPLNGRQFANLAALVPGVGLGFHSDVAKNTQYAPQISGGNGRNINYVVDGGDDNDDVNGGLMQQFPLDAIQEFEVITQRFSAEHGRSNGAILNVVTRSGTNAISGSLFSLFRDDALNGRTMSERNSGIEKQPYSREQFGGSAGGPIIRSRLHYFAAYERTQQETNQAVNTTLFADQNGVHEIPLRQNLFTGKVTATLRQGQQLAVRVGSERSSQVSSAGPQFAPSSWGFGKNTFYSTNVNHNWVVGGAALNQFVFQHSDVTIDIPLTTPGPAIGNFDLSVRGGGTFAPQLTEQTKWQFRDDVSWSVSGIGGLVHQFKVGASWLHEPRLFLSTLQGRSGLIMVVDDRVDSPVLSVSIVGGDTAGNLPMNLYGVYVQDDWRVSNRLTLNLGVRWDYLDGLPLDQSESVNFQSLQTAGQTGRFAGTILEDFGAQPRTDKNNVQPRVGAVFDLRGDGRDVIRGGWGVYNDFAYIASNAATAMFDALGGGGATFLVAGTLPNGIIKPDGTPFRITDPIESIASLDIIRGTPPRFGEVVSPLLEQPYTRQANVGWSHLLDDATSISADYVRVDGRDLNMRVRPNVVVNGARFLAGLNVAPQGNGFRAAVSKGSSRYDGLILALRRRLRQGLDLNASYTLSKATSDVGTASDEIVQNLIQDISDPFGPVQQGPSYRTDSRHQVSLSAIVQLPGAVQVAPILYYRSALPVHTWEGSDQNGDLNQNDKTALAYRYTGLDDRGRATFVEDGPCDTVNCSRRAPFSQLNVRVSRAFRIGQSLRIEAIGEMFNVFNAANPSFPLMQARNIPSDFMQPTAFAGDAGQPEQRVGQIGLRVTF